MKNEDLFKHHKNLLVEKLYKYVFKSLYLKQVFSIQEKKNIMKDPWIHFLKCN